MFCELFCKLTLCRGDIEFVFVANLIDFEIGLTRVIGFELFEEPIPLVLLNKTIRLVVELFFKSDELV